MAALSAFFCRWRGAAARPQPLNAPVAQPAQHVDMHGRIFVSNLFWQPLPNPRTAIQDARAFGIQNGWTWGVIRSGARAQAGFASLELGLAANARDIAPLLAMRQWHSESQIKRLRWRDAYPRRMIAGAVLALAGFALVGYWLASMRSRPASQPGVRAQRALRAPQNTLNGAPSAQRLPDRAYPWMRQASAQAFARACTTAIGALPLNLAGWRFDHARCKESIV